MSTRTLSVTKYGMTKKSIVLSVMIGGILTIILVQSIALAYEPQPFVYNNPSTIELKPALVRAETEEERITRKIKAAFPDAPIMVRVARAESELKSVWGRIDPDDCGIFQINQRYHGKAMAELGLDCMNENDNIAFAKILYEKFGLRPWLASKDKWL